VPFLISGAFFGLTSPAYLGCLADGLGEAIQCPTVIGDVEVGLRGNPVALQHDQGCGFAIHPAPPVFNGQEAKAHQGTMPCKERRSGNHAASGTRGAVRLIKHVVFIDGEIEADHLVLQAYKVGITLHAVEGRDHLGLIAVGFWVEPERQAVAMRDLAGHRHHDHRVAEELDLPALRLIGGLFLSGLDAFEVERQTAETPTPPITKALGCSLGHKE
jgi:hypothetical protein